MQRLGFSTTWIALAASWLATAAACPAADDTEDSGANPHADGGSGGPAGTDETDGAGAGATTAETTGEVTATGATSTGGGGLDGVCEGALSDSFGTWSAARDAAGGSYDFTVDGVVVINDPCSVDDLYVTCRLQTTLSVDGGAVVARTLLVTPENDATAADCPEPYEEAGADVGSHADGYPVRTLDDVYTACCDAAEMAGGYLEDYGDDYSPGDLVVTIGDDGYLDSCSTQYCDDCGCTGSRDVVSAIDLGG